MEHSAKYRAGCLGIFMRKRIKTPGGIAAVNSDKIEYMYIGKKTFTYPIKKVCRMSFFIAESTRKAG